MKTTLRQPHAALRILVGLLFAFIMIIGAVAQTPPLPWDGSIADKIENVGDHDGSSADKAILIKDAAELAYLAKQVNDKGLKLDFTNGTSISNSDQDKQGFTGLYFALSADINLNRQKWTPIGIDYSNRFQGHFDGDGHVIKGLKVDIQVSGNDVYAGLFGYVENGTLRNLGVWLAPEGIVASSSGSNKVYAGGLVGCITSTDQATPAAIRNCYVEAEGNGAIRITGNAHLYAGGIAGVSSVSSSIGSSTITHCYATVDVDAKSSGNEVSVGGIAGYNSMNISYAHATGKVEGHSGGSLNSCTGGICGETNNGPIKNCLALNKEISCIATGGGDEKKNRIVGSANSGSCSDNYANPRMTLNGSTITSGNADDQNGAPTWYNKLKNDLDPSSNNEWNNAWEWTDGELPQLRKENADGSDYSSDLVGGQTPHKATDYLSHSPWDVSAATEIENTGGNDGTFGTPILIKDAAELAYLAQQVNAGGALTLSNGTSSIPNNNGFLNIYFALSADIDLDGGEWTLIGDLNKRHPFKGHFDGDGHTVDGLKMDISSGSIGNHLYVGLFGKVSGGTICNLGVRLDKDGIKVTAARSEVYVGGIVGHMDNSPLLRNCYVVGDGKIKVEGMRVFAGGIAGLGALTHCYATVDVEVTMEVTNLFCEAGGIVGQGGPLSYAYATGSVKVTGRGLLCAGGLGGYLGGAVTNNLALNGEVSVVSGSNCHRIVGVYKPGNNYATTRMKLNGQPATGGTIDNNDGADTWLDTYVNDLQSLSDPIDADKSWVNGNNWSGTTSGNLPQLRKVILDAGNNPTSYADWPSSSPQPTLPASSYLTDKPKPIPPPTPPVVEPEPEPTPPTVYHTVTLPAVEGATTDPVPGTYEVESWSTFRFYLTLDTAYSESQPVVTTSRYETLLPRSSDGAYLLKYVRTDVEVYLDGIVKNPDPVGNEKIEADYPKVWKSGNNLHMQAIADEPGYIYTADGKLQAICNLIAGEVGTIQLPVGIYFVRIGNERFKVVL